MKVGVLTFHGADNYGAVLQAYALKTHIQGLGHDVSVIDYSPAYISEEYRWLRFRYWFSPNPKKLFKRLLREPFLVAKRRKRHLAFNQFREKELSLSPKTRNNLSFGFDCIVIGSDQIWSPEHTGGDFDSIYFGEGFACKTIAYAASSKLSKISKLQEERLKVLLTNLYAISVREKSLLSLFQPLTQKVIHCVLDPTLIINKSFFSNLSLKPKYNFDYVCVYEITPYAGTKVIAQRLADQINAKVIEISSHIRDTKDTSIIMTASIEEFLGLLLNARCVITTSFHGLALSIKNNVDFYAVKVGNNNDNRLLNLLKICELDNRFVSMESNPKFEHINYKKTNDILDNEIFRSKYFLSNALDK